MKKTRLISITFLLISAAAAAAVPALAQTRPADMSSGTDPAEPQIKLLPKAAPRTAKSRTKAKKTPFKPVSEYKFDRIDHKPAYTFDKKTNPIIKEPKPKKTAIKKSASGNNNSGAAASARKAQNAKPAAGGEEPDGKLQFPEGSSQPPRDQTEE